MNLGEVRGIVNNKMENTEVIIQTTEKPTQDRIKLIEIQKDETEQELKCLYEILNQEKKIKETIKPNTTAGQEIQAFIRKLETEIQINTGIKEEYEQSIEFIKTGEGIRH